MEHYGIIDVKDFEGTLVLEQLAAIARVDEFFEAIDSDDIERATRLMKKAKVDAKTIAIVARKMEESDGEHCSGATAVQESPSHTLAREPMPTQG